MSINVYLNKGILELEGFKTQPYKDGSGDEMILNGTHVYRQDGRLHISWNETAPITEELRGLVEEISWYEQIPQTGRREAGIYRHKSAECDLTPEDRSSNKRENRIYILKLRAKTLEDAHELMHMIKTGTIRPSESYEGDQQGLSRAELESELKRAQIDNKIIRGQLELCQGAHEFHRQTFDNACEKNVLFGQLAKGLLESGAWSLVRRRKVGEMIKEILEFSTISSS